MKSIIMKLIGNILIIYKTIKNIDLILNEKMKILKQIDKI